MFRRLAQERFALSAVIVVVITVALMSLTAHQRDRLSAVERMLQDAVEPLQHHLHQAAAGVTSQLERWRDVRFLWAENQVLSKKAGLVEELQHRLEELNAENERLRALLGFARTLEAEYIPAGVTGRNPDNWFQTITINRGSLHGVSPNDVVVTSQGLVGRVSTVSARSATVMLILDPDSGVGAMVQRTRDAGVALGSAGDRRFLHMKMFFREASVAPGDVIVTSGLSYIFPKGILVGVVESVGIDHSGLVKTARIRPAVDFHRLEEVLVIKNPGWER
ncbi:MAG: rod shape-determining protein MreC [Bacillota bacterium]